MHKRFFYFFNSLISSALTLNGDGVVTSNLVANSIQSKTTLSTTSLFVTGIATIDSLAVTSASSFLKTIKVSGDATFEGSISSKLDGTSDVHSDNVVVQKDAIIGGGMKALSGSFDQSIFVPTITTRYIKGEKGSLLVDGDLHFSNSILVTGTSKMEGVVTMTRSLSVASSISAESISTTTQIATPTIKTESISSNSGTFSIGASTTISGTLSVSQKVSLTNDLSVAGNLETVGSFSAHQTSSDILFVKTGATFSGVTAVNAILSATQVNVATSVIANGIETKQLTSDEMCIAGICKREWPKYKFTYGECKEEVYKRVGNDQNTYYEIATCPAGWVSVGSKAFVYEGGSDHGIALPTTIKCCELIISPAD